MALPMGWTERMGMRLYSLLAAFLLPKLAASAAQKQQQLASSSFFPLLLSIIQKEYQSDERLAEKTRAMGV